MRPTLAALRHQARSLGNRQRVRHAPIAGGIDDQALGAIALDDDGHSFAAHLGVGINRKRAPVSAVANLAGVPSIVFGLFGLGFFVQFVGTEEPAVEELLPAGERPTVAAYIEK